MAKTIRRAILDTSILIGFTHDHPDAKMLFSTLRRERIVPCISVMTLTEIEIGNIDERHKQEVQKLISEFEYYSFTPEMAPRAAELLAIYKNDRQRKAHMLPDAIIAATAEIERLNIYTANYKHFRDFKLIHSEVIGYQQPEKTSS